MDISDRMKGYEQVWDIRMPARLPVIIRLDGNSFSKLTKKMGFDKPYDVAFRGYMARTTKAVLEYCSGAVIGYTQSDEISILLNNFTSLESEPFLANRIQKLTSLTASIAASAFNYCLDPVETKNLAAFDCRVFVLPESEVNNYFLWRQQDAFRNCVSSYCHYKIGDAVGRGTADAMTHGKNINEQQELLFKHTGINIDSVPTWQKRGFCVTHVLKSMPMKEALSEEALEKVIKIYGKVPDENVVRGSWFPDFEIPLFNQDTSYVWRGGSEKDQELGVGCC